MDELGEIPRHSFPVMRNQDAPGGSRQRQDNGIGGIDDITLLRVGEIDSRFPPPHSPHSLMVKIGVSLKSGPRAGLWMPLGCVCTREKSRRAAASLA